MKKALAMLGMALTVVFSVPAVHAEQVGTDTANPNTVIIRDVTSPTPDTVIIRDVTNTIDYNTVIIRDMALAQDNTVIIRDEAPNFIPDWTLIIRNLEAAYPGMNFTTEQTDPNTVIIRGTSSDASPNTVIIRDSADPATVIIR